MRGKGMGNNNEAEEYGGPEGKRHAHIQTWIVKNIKLKIREMRKKPSKILLSLILPLL